MKLLILFCFLLAPCYARVTNRDRFISFRDSMTNCQNPSKRDTDCTARDRRFRTIDGTCNNLNNRDWGAAGTRLPRFLQAQFFDAAGVDTPFGHPDITNQENVRSAQNISEELLEIIDTDSGNRRNVAYIVMTFGQLLDHDLVHIFFDGNACQNTQCRIPDDFETPCFPIKGTTAQSTCVRFVRSFAACGRGRRENINALTSYLDGSMVYGSSESTSTSVRGENGKLRVNSTDQGDLLPFDTESTEPCNGRGGCFLAGDGRNSENIALAGIHTMFVRLHNHYVDKLAEQDNTLTSNELYNEARRIVIAIIQKIAFFDWLNVIVGTLRDYEGYNANVNSGVRNEFATAAFRFGHTLIRNEFSLLDTSFNEQGRVLLRDAFFDNREIFANGIERVMYGLIANRSEAADNRLAAAIGKHLFIKSDESGFENLGALNIQRARDHGIPSYTKLVEFCRNITVNRFSDFNDLPGPARRRLEEVYGSVDNYIDPFPALLAEGPGQESQRLLGPTLQCLIRRQFAMLRDGDRFYFENDDIYTEKQQTEIKKVTLAQVMCLTLRNIVSIQSDVFRIVPNVRRLACNNDNFPPINMATWLEERNRKDKKEVRDYKDRDYVDDFNLEFDELMTLKKK